MSAGKHEKRIGRLPPYHEADSIQSQPCSCRKSQLPQPAKSVEQRILSDRPALLSADKLAWCFGVLAFVSPVLTAHTQK